jgi:hypothetical protein
MSESDAPTGEIHRPVSGAYERTWELELLISGAVTFALLQLPDVVDRWFFAAEPRLMESTRPLFVTGYQYAKFILYALIPSFIVHLAARAYWVGLIGLDSVFPRGVDWEALGPRRINRVVHRERNPSLEALIRATDKFCSIIFSFAFSITFIFLFSIVAMIALWLATFAISSLLFGGERFGEIFVGIAVLLFGPVVLASAIDALIGHRLDPARGLGRVMYHVHRINYVSFMGVAYFPTFNILASNLRKVTFYPLFYGALVLLMAVFLVKDMLIPAGVLTAAGYEFLPDRADSYTIEHRHYADQRRLEKGFRRLVPFIQGEAIRGPYVRLFIPYTRRHNEAIRRDCPELPELGGSGPRIVRRTDPEPTATQMRALFACLQRVQPVFLNGERLEPSYRLATDPLYDIRGVLAFIPTASLPAGENVLRIPAVRREEEPTPRDTFHIPFWMVR